MTFLQNASKDPSLGGSRGPTACKRPVAAVALRVHARGSAEEASGLAPRTLSPAATPNPYRSRGALSWRPGERAGRGQPARSEGSEIDPAEERSLSPVKRLRRRGQGRPGLPGRPPPEHLPARPRAAVVPLLLPSQPLAWRQVRSHDLATRSSRAQACTRRKAEPGLRPLRTCPCPTHSSPPHTPLDPTLGVYGTPRET